MFLKQLKLADLNLDKKYNFIIPIGSTEQHGPFLPFGTDTFSTDEFLKRINQHFPELIILPTLEYSCSGEHEGFIGTIWLQETTLTSILNDVCNSIAPYANSVMVLSGHGGNLATIQDFVKEKQSFYTTSLHYIDLDDENLVPPMEKLVGGELGSHAGNIETSMMMAIEPNLVQEPGDYNKVPILDPWQTGKLRDKSQDGIADPQSKWVISKDIGEKVTKFKGIIKQRQNTYGTHFDNEGNFIVDPKQYENLEFETA